MGSSKPRLGDHQNIPWLQCKVLLQVTAVNQPIQLDADLFGLAVDAAHELRAVTGGELGQSHLDHDIQQRQSVPERNRLRPLYSRPHNAYLVIERADTE